LAPNACPGHTEPSSNTRRQSLGFQGFPAATAETAFRKSRFARSVRGTRAGEQQVACEGCARAVSEERVKTCGATGV
jgi:hypothetical protein